MPQTAVEGSGNFMDKTDDVSTPSVQVFDSNLSELTTVMNNMSEQFSFSTSTVDNFLANGNELESFQFGNGPNNCNYLLDNRMYSSNINCNMDPLHSSALPIITEPTPPPSGLNMHDNQNQTTNASLQQKQKIFIKNVDILKEPQFQEPRGTLHLRTVDELNLMNKNEVENLITPNLEQNSTISMENFNEFVENSKLPEETFYDQVVTNWSESYDLGDDIDCIITGTISPTSVAAATQTLQKIIYDLDTPQMSLISIRDTENLSVAPNQTSISNNFSHRELEVTDAAVQPIETTPVRVESLITANEASVQNTTFTTVDSEQRRGSELSNSVRSPQVNDAATKQKRPSKISVLPREVPTQVMSCTSLGINYDDVPPLAPVSNISLNNTTIALTPPTLSRASLPTAKDTTSTTTTTTTANTLLNIPVPPLVPVSPYVTVSKAFTPTVTLTTQTTAEKGRIYVANNLMQSTTAKLPTEQMKSPANIVTGGTSVRGRPYGPKSNGTSQIRKLHGKSTDTSVGLKCSTSGCTFRFKKPETLTYHKQCHSSNPATPQAIVCPECQRSDFTQWNTLHTHLWRSHNIDMELYKCEICSFKTPIFSRLINTHLKTHSEDRNFKCEQCHKAFKNTKQLKNHRRWHRYHAKDKGTVSNSKETTNDVRQLYRCNDCNSAFSNQKTLREHLCKNNDTQLQCKICSRLVSSKSSLKLHMFTHMESDKRFKCALCDYTANDHNAFRRHKMIHTNRSAYSCSYCDYKSIQSVAYQKHIQQKHPDKANSVIYKCNLCSFSTINQTLFTVHQAKHETVNENNVNNAGISDTTTSFNDANQRISNESLINVNETDKHNLNFVVQNQMSPKTKIKVKNNLLQTNLINATHQIISTNVASNALDISNV